MSGHRKHGHSNGGGVIRATPEYSAWLNMRNRCKNPNGDHFHRYGGRGISVCERWQGENGFENFLSDIGLRPSLLHSLDRIDNDGNYEPGNCRWTTRREQRLNQGHGKFWAWETHAEMVGA